MKIAVLLSGGVDSSVSLALLKEQGHALKAFYLKIWLEDELSYLGQCPWEEDLDYAKAVCKKFDVSLEIIPFQKEYFDGVVKYTINEIKTGRTPNPDIMCNNLVKFGAFLDIYGEKFDKIATGHYANVKKVNNEFWLYRSPDKIKDQTYFLSMLNQYQLSKAIFPIGQYLKEEVRKLAHDFDLPNKDRKDSQGICFLGKIKFADFIKHHVGVKIGVLKEYETGEELGTHNGFWFYTIGQRHSIGLAGGPWYVVKKDTKNNIVYISKNYYSIEKSRDIVKVKNFNWIGIPPDLPADLLVKFRHGPEFHKAHVSFSDNFYVIKLSESDQGIAPGQFAVLYKNARCLGGGVMGSC